jgi:hypothetical protein
MKADELRKISEETKENFANKWWEEISPTLFRAMFEVASSNPSTSNSLQIGVYSGLNKENWVYKIDLVKKAKEELKKLGFKVTYSSDYHDCTFIIEW